MGVAGPNIEPCPYNLAKMHNFYRSTNDVIRLFCYLHWFSIQKNLPEDSIPDVQCSMPYSTLCLGAMPFDPIQNSMHKIIFICLKRNLPLFAIRIFAPMPSGLPLRWSEES